MTEILKQLEPRLQSKQEVEGCVGCVAPDLKRRERRSCGLHLEGSPDVGCAVLIIDYARRRPGIPRNHKDEQAESVLRPQCTGISRGHLGASHGYYAELRMTSCGF